MKRKTYTTLATIHLGSETLKMNIVEYRNLDKVKVIERLSRRIRLGEATFKNKIIPFNLVNEICEILEGFKRLMTEYAVEEYILQATTAVQEASNQVFLLDQICNRTGLKVDVIDMPQEIFTKYCAVRNTLRQNKVVDSRDSMLMMDISSGGLGITLVEDDKIKYQENFHIGIIRIKESFGRARAESIHFNCALTEYLTSTIGPVRRTLKENKVRYLTLTGTETELVLKILRLDENQRIHRIKAAVFHEYYNKIVRMNEAQIISTYGLNETAAEICLPTFIIYEQLLTLVPAEEIIITNDSYIEGMELLYIGQKTSEIVRKGLEQEKLNLLHCIGERYLYDKRHVQQVERLAMLIFDKIAKNYGMDDRERMLLRAACLLHDIGKFVSMRSHSKHTYQLIRSTDIIGFSDEDKLIIALTAYYHANTLINNTNPDAPPMDKKLTPVVAKLAAILRLADALDRSYGQKVRSCEVTLRNGELHVIAESKVDMALEIWTFEDKAAFFEQVYGVTPVLERVGK